MRGENLLTAHRMLYPGAPSRFRIFYLMFITTENPCWQGRPQADVAALGPASWCLDKMLIFARYTLRLRIQ